MQNNFQHAVISLPRRHGLFLWLNLKDGLTDKTAKDVAATVVKKLRAHECSDNAIGFGQKFYKKIGGKQDTDFTYKGWQPDLPPRDGDIFIHGKQDSRGMLYQLTREIMDSIQDSVQQYEDIYGFTYPGPYGYDRDESGFIDAKGTLSGWIGRDLESGAVLQNVSKDAHIARVQADNIVRQGMPYGDYKEGGLFFLAYSKTPTAFNSLLDNISGTTGPKDLILGTKMTSNKTGGDFFYFPGKSELDTLL